MKNPFKRDEEVIVVKKITYTRFFILLFLLFLIDTTSSYIAVKQYNVSEMNPFASFFFNHGIKGLLLWFIFGGAILSMSILYLFVMETTFYSHQRQYFRMKILYMIFGVYAFVFVWNLRSILLMNLK